MKAKFFIEDKFILTEFGLVFSGQILQGKVSTDDDILFEFNNEELKRKINGVQLTTNSFDSEELSNQNRIMTVSPNYWYRQEIPNF